MSKFLEQLSAITDEVGAMRETFEGSKNTHRPLWVFLSIAESALIGAIEQVEAIEGDKEAKTN